MICIYERVSERLSLEQGPSSRVGYSRTQLSCPDLMNRNRRNCHGQRSLVSRLPGFFPGNQAIRLLLHASNPCVWCSWTDQSANARPKQIMVGACSAAVTIKVKERKKESRPRSHYKTQGKVVPHNRQNNKSKLPEISIRTILILSSI
jgi:hypothetical protein